MSAHFLLSRRWVVRHVLAFVVVATCIGLALWQVQRLQDRRAENSRLAARAKLPVVQLETLLGSAGDPDEAAYRRVTASGTYDSAEEVLLRSRSHKNRPGNHLLTPLRTGGTAVVVDRGWVPIEIGEPGAEQALPPSSEVEVEGILLPAEGRGAFGIADPPPGEVDSLPRVDLERLEKQLPYPIAPLYLRLTRQQPAGADLPEPVPLAPLNEGPHFDYAVQWSFFALASLIVYLALIRREARGNVRPAPQPNDAPAAG